MQKAALLSVSDKTGLVDFARGLEQLGFVLLSTSGTLKALQDAGVAVQSVEDYTGQEEILDGRVKTLHPKIHAGILARGDDSNHQNQLADNKILPIALVVVNLYPFIQTLDEARRSGGDCSLSRMVEKIDIGGPTMIRAAAKNHSSVIPVIDPADYGWVLDELQNGGDISAEKRKGLASKVFTAMAGYDLAIAEYLTEGELGELSQVVGVVGRQLQPLRYGENPQQRAGLYGKVNDRRGVPWRQLHGKELSYNNLLDVDAAISLLATFREDRPTVAILKHLNPCGVASGATLREALKRAKACDPRSHFGGIVCFNGEVGAEEAASVQEDFAEIVVAPGFAPEALAILQQKKALRVVVVDSAWIPGVELRTAAGALLVQEPDSAPLIISPASCVTTNRASEIEMADLLFAWKVCRQVKSNAIVVAHHEMTVGVGAGQMSRVDSVEVALMKADRHGHSLTGAVAASDAFFPFPDSVELLAERGVVAIVSPKGARRDEEVIAVCNQRGVALYLVEDRHFRH
jgi:phosphoribosylaminoimidazolecarboxamide formyltransferase/IMP cyclohydrolase